MALEPVFEAEAAADAAADERFVVDVDGFEGPLDLLLDLARRQKVDLHRVSILDLANQYLAFVDEARRVRLELAADYLVMAAWLAYLKSRLLLPRAKKDNEPEAGELAAALAVRLQKLQAIRLAAQALQERPRVGRDLALRGLGDATILDSGPVRWDAKIYDLMAAYARQRQKHALTRVALKRRVVWSLIDAREAVERLAGQAVDWMALDHFILSYCVTPDMRRTVRASAFCATMDMVREGRITVRQDEAFAPVWVKTCAAADVERRAGGQG